MEENPTRICELLGGVEVLDVDETPGAPLGAHIETPTARPTCGACGGPVWSKGSGPVGLADLAAFGRPVRLVWHKHRWRCPAASCAVGSFTEVDEQIAPARAAGRRWRWAATPVRWLMWPPSWVAIGTPRTGLLAWGEALLAADSERVGAVAALVLDATLLGRASRWRTRSWRTSIVDVHRGQLLDVVPGRALRVRLRGSSRNRSIIDRPQLADDAVGG